MDVALDRQALVALQADLGGDRGVVVELADSFLREAPRLVALAIDGAAKGDAKSLHRAVHTLKSNAATFGARRLSDLCRALEAEAAVAVPADAPARAAAVAAEWGRVERELRAWRAGDGHQK